MKPRTQIILVGALLIALMALSSMKHGPRSDNAGQNRGACCPFLPAPGALPLSSMTNGTAINCNPSTPPATNLTPSHKQP
jgi:hypothetical protein